MATMIGMVWWLVSGLPHGEDMRYTRARDDLRALRSALLISSRMPNTAEGLETLVHEGLVSFLPQDPWGRPYQYRAPGMAYAWELFSLGPDGVESRDDLSIWHLYGGG
jgi:general secretion pathway protein G